LGPGSTHLQLVAQMCSRNGAVDFRLLGQIVGSFNYFLYLSMNPPGTTATTSILGPLSMH
jgi:hypothetical protein